MTASYILALDQGTTSCRALLFDRKGKKVGLAQKEFTQIFPKDGWVEHDGEEIWRVQKSVIHSLLDQTGIAPESLAGIGITNQRETTLIWDRQTGIPVGRALVWQDRRTAAYCSDLRDRGHEITVRQKTGLLLDPYFSASKIAWILQNDRTLQRRAREGALAFGTMDTWLLWKLTDGKVHRTDISNASRTMLFNIHDKAWDQDLLDLFEIPAALLPEVHENVFSFGTTSKEAIGFSAPVFGMAGDQQAALFGQGCFEKGEAKNTYGTGCFLVLNTGDEVTESKHRLVSTIGWSIRGRMTYALEGSVFTGGSVIQWLRDGLGVLKDASEAEAMATTVENNGGITFVPALTGLGSPHWDPYARGSIFGLTRNSRSEHLVRAALESIALQVDDLVSAVQSDLGRPLDALRVDGGAATNDFLMQLQADLLNMPILRSAELETTALGVALMAGMGASWYADLDAVSGCIETNRIFSPNPSNDAPLLRTQWARAVARSKNWIQP